MNPNDSVCHLYVYIYVNYNWQTSLSRASKSAFEVCSNEYINTGSLGYRLKLASA